MRWGALAVVYFGAAKGGLALAYAHGQVTAVWPPSGIALAAAFFWGYRAWPGVLLGAFLANLSTGAPVPVDLGIGLGNTAEAVVGALLLRRAGFRPSLARIRDVAALALLASGLSTIIAATVGTTSLWLGNLVSAHDLPSVWRVWWLGDAGGDLLVAPLLMLAATGAFRQRLGSARVLEATAVAVALVGLSVLSFTGSLLPYVVFPALIWAAVRFHQPGATAASVTVASLAVWFTAHHMGPFVSGSPDDSLLLSQTFVGVVHMTVLVLAAVTFTRDQAEHAVREAEARKAAMLDAALDGVITADHVGRIIEFNPAAQRMFGWGLEEVRGKELAETIIPPRLREQHRQGLADYLASGTPRVIDQRVELAGVHSDGREFPLEVCVTRINREGPPLFTAFVRDITDRKGAEEQLRFLAEHDPLTGLVNRRRFEEELVRQIAYAERYTFGGVLLIMDADNLKAVNDSYGHAAGDMLLKGMADTLRRHLRKSDVLGRVGGDEFVALLPAVSAEEAVGVVEHLLWFVRENRVVSDGHEIRAGLSVGIAPITAGTTVETLLSQADRAMYLAKARGGDQACVYSAAQKSD